MMSCWGRVGSQGGGESKPDYKAVREAISEILEAENYDDGETTCLSQ